MYTVFLAGGIASGKSTVARMLVEHGARRIDLDQVSRDVLAPGSPCTLAVAAEFGQDLVDEKNGALDRSELARRAFASPGALRTLEELEMPYIKLLLAQRMGEAATSGSVPCCVVEIPLLDRVEEMLDMADEVVSVVCPLALRKERAIGRGVAPEDFDARIRHQPSDEYLRAHSSTVIVNDGGAVHLQALVDQWWTQRFAGGEVSYEER